MTDLKLVDYSEFSIALFGDSRHLRNEIVERKIGKWNSYLTYDGKQCGGWIFAKKHRQVVEQLMNGEISAKETKLVDTPEASGIAIKAKPLAATYSKSELERYMLSNLHILGQCFGAEMKLASVVMNDLSILPDDGKRYLFLGGGCGFSWIKYDGRNKLAKQIVEDAEAMKHKIDIAFKNTIDIEYRKKLEASGNPIEAHLFQNLAYKDCYNSLVIKFMSNYLDTKKAKVYMDSRLD